MINADVANLYCVYNTINLIEQQYDQPISIKAIEAVSNYSYRNIQRIFKYSCGETIGAYQQRLRVENAYKLILYTKESLTTIALKVGFANLASFSKAFKQHFGISPKLAKSGKAQLFSTTNIIPVKAEGTLKPEIVYLPPVKVYYKSTFIQYTNHEIELLWSNFVKHSFPLRETEYFGIIADEPLIRDELACKYDACASQPAADQKLPSKIIMGGRYAQFLHKGKYDTLDGTYQKIYAGWILDCGLEFSQNPIIERYIKHVDNTEREEEQLTAILLPLK
ncbi:AraC family transcriptional regulator [Pedobacter kyungheensis]|uniref:AraC family transcriptional regulator n=1 Tax=Pedobacter kyungheensis TaxID=1069985 RepID=A0A0C1D9K6_9SPHI|nr:AraC family transcriptional regulator [Pedobacter kyungheensis]KIA94066.1 AraC family transcriptional regulator [Pedobacter kyungheensis]